MVNISTYSENPRPAKKRYFKRLQAHLAMLQMLFYPEQCMRKWLKLEGEGQQQRTGRANQTWKFHDQIASV